MLYCTIQNWAGVIDSYILQGKGLIWWCCRERKHRQNLQNNDTSGWIQQADKMCLLMSDRADADPFSQLMLLLPNVSISAADWATKFPSWYPSAFHMSSAVSSVSVNEHTLRNIHTAWSWGCPLIPAYFCTFFDF